MEYNMVFQYVYNMERLNQANWKIHHIIYLTIFVLKTFKIYLFVILKYTVYYSVQLHSVP